MLPSKITIRSPYPLKKNLLADPKADLFLSLGGKILPIHRALVADCEYIKSQFGDKKLYIIDEPLDIGMVEIVLSYFYGFEIKITKKQELIALLDVVDYFGAEKLREQMQDEIGQRFQEFDVFFIMELAYQFSLEKIFKMSFQALQMEEFQQINYNKFDFIQCDFKLFQIVLRRHHSLKNAAKILGQPFQTIEEIITLYCQRYHFDINTENRLLEKYGRKSASKIKLSAKTDRSYVEPTKKILETNRSTAESSRLEYYAKGDKNKGKNNQEQKSTSPQSNLVSSARLKKKKKDPASKQQYQKISKAEFLFKFGGDSIKTKHQTLPSPIPEELQTTQSKKQIGYEGNKEITQFSPNIRVINSGTKHLKTEEDKLEDNSLGHFQDEDPEYIAGKISTLLDQYVTAYHEHEDKFQAMKKNAKSMIFKETSQREIGRRKESIFDAGRIAQSRALDYKQLSNTLQIPQK